MPLTVPKKSPPVFLLVFRLIGVLLFFLVLIQNLAVSKVEAASKGFVSSSGTKLYLNGQEYQFTGVNAFNLATYPGFNAGCGGYVEDLDAYFSKLRPNSVVRFWAFQGAAATNVTTKKLDWSSLDRVVNAAQKNGMKLIPVLGNQDGHCDDGHYKDKAWYSGGFNQSFNDLGNGLTPMPYLDYVKAVVTRYKDSPAIAMWEPVNEPAAGDCLSGTGYQCYEHLECKDEAGSATAMKAFFDTVGGAMKAIDPNHLISSGTLGNGQCGTVFEDYKLVHSSSGIDVGSYHDYDAVDSPVPGDPWNGLQKRIDQMTSLNKPLYIGEVGMIAGGSGCMSLSDRQIKMKAKMDAQFGAGIAGFTPWSYNGGTSAGCNYDFGSSDQLVTLLHDYPVSMSTDTSTTATPFPVATPIPKDTTSPTAPTVLTASNLTNSAVTLNWSGATDNIGIDRYEVYKDWGYVTAVWGNTYTLTNLTPGKNYLFYIKSKDKVGNSSGESIKLNVYIPTVIPTPTPTPIPTPLPADLQSPTAPTILTPSNLTPTAVTLNWSGATDNRGIDRYELYKDWSYFTAVWGTSYTMNGLTPGKSYLFYLKSRDAAGNSSGESVKVTVVLPYATSTPTPSPTPSPTPKPSADTVPPTAPTSLTASEVTSNSVTLSWTGATDNVGINRYEVYKDWGYVTAVWGNSYKVTGLSSGKKYLFYLKTRDNAGNSSGESVKLNVTTLL
jgi:hypothetical protein